MGRNKEFVKTRETI